MTIPAEQAVILFLQDLDLSLVALAHAQQLLLLVSNTLSHLQRQLGYSD